MKKLLRKCLNFRLTGWSMAIALFSLLSANTAGAWTVYLDQVPSSWGSSTPYVWAWQTGKDGTAMMGTGWPGKAMTKTNGVWTYTQADSNGIPDQIIFSNNGANQIGDFTFENNAHYDTSGVVGKQTYTYTMAYFKNTDNWAKVCVYSWEPTLNGAWPGQQLELKPGTTDTYVWTVTTQEETKPTPGKFQFNNGSNQKQIDIQNFVQDATYLPDGSIEGQGPNYSSWWVNIIGEYNWDFPGQQPNADTNIATLTNIPIGTNGFKAKIWNGTNDSYYVYNSELPLNQWVTLTKGEESSPVNQIQGATANSVYDVQYNVESNQINITLVSGGTPEPATLYVRGNLVNGENTFNSVSDDVKMTYDDGVYTWEGESLGTGFKIADANWTAANNYGGDGQKIKITVNGNPVTVVANSDSKDIVFSDETVYIVNPVVTLDPSAMTVTLTGESTAKVAVTSMVIKGTLDGEWTEGGEELFTLSADPDNNYLWTGTMTGLAPESQFQIVVNDNFWYGWGSSALYNNAPINVNLSNATGDMSITNILETATVNVSVNWETGDVTFSSDDQPTLQPEMLWAVGPFNGWQPDQTEYVLEQVGDNTGIYTGTFEWDETCEYEDDDVNFASFKLSFGSVWEETLGNPNKEEKVLYSPNNTYETTFIVNGNDWTIANWAGGEITITVDLNKQTVTIECPDQPAFQYPASVTLMGSFDSWLEGYEMEDLGNGSYSVSVSLPAEDVEFKILADDVWYGAVTGESNIPLKPNTPVDYDMATENAPNWKLVNFEGGDVVFTATFSEDGSSLNLNQTSATGISQLGNAFSGEEVIFNLQGVRVNKNNLRPGIYIVNGKKVVIR